MKIAKIRVENIKCDGCVDTIRKSLSEVAGISELLIDKNTQMVEFKYGNDLNLEIVAAHLNQLGYPVKETNPGHSDLADDKSSRLIK
jgi:copper chaperone